MTVGTICDLLKFIASPFAMAAQTPSHLEVFFFRYVHAAHIPMAFLTVHANSKVRLVRKIHKVRQDEYGRPQNRFIFFDMGGKFDQRFRFWHNLLMTTFTLGQCRDGRTRTTVRTRMAKEALHTIIDMWIMLERQWLLRRLPGIQQHQDDNDDSPRDYYTNRNPEPW